MIKVMLAFMHYQALAQAEVVTPLFAATQVCAAMATLEDLCIICKAS